ncbi:MAG: ATP-binding protein [Clostridiaceae bacterium]|nr:ATP-binding protein [Eubacteriales bacterium]
MVMKEIALHLLDIVQNSLSAGANLITVAVDIDEAKNLLSVSVNDNGRGMDEETKMRVVSPFFTSRGTRRVGLGIPFFKEGAEGCGGSFYLNSAPGEGTGIGASYALDHIDRPPLGNMAETMLTLCVCNENVDFVLRYARGQAEFTFDTRGIRAALGEGVPFSAPEVMQWLKAYLIEGIEEVNGGRDI